MCIYWYKRYACGHIHPDLRKTTLTHCHAFDIALRHWHSQTRYQTLETVLEPGSTLPAPSKCPEVWAIGQWEQAEPIELRQQWDDQLKNKQGSFRCIVERQETLDKQANVDQQRATAQHFPFGAHVHMPSTPTSRDGAGNMRFVSALDQQIFKKKNRKSKAGGRTSPPLPRAPYPAGYLSYFYLFEMYQEYQRTFPEPNVIVQNETIGCGRFSEPACLCGIVELNQVQCPWLLAQRLPQTDQHMESKEIFRAEAKALEFLRDIDQRGSHLNLDSPDHAELARNCVVWKGNLRLDSATVDATDEHEGYGHRAMAEEPLLPLSPSPLPTLKEDKKVTDPSILSDPNIVAKSLEQLTLTPIGENISGKANRQHRDGEIPRKQVGMQEAREEPVIAIEAMPDWMHECIQAKVPSGPTLSNGTRVAGWGDWKFPAHIQEHVHLCLGGRADMLTPIEGRANHQNQMDEPFVWTPAFANQIPGSHGAMAGTNVPMSQMHVGPMAFPLSSNFQASPSVVYGPPSMPTQPFSSPAYPGVANHLRTPVHSHGQPDHTELRNSRQQRGGRGGRGGRRGFSRGVLRGGGRGNAAPPVPRNNLQRHDHGVSIYSRHIFQQVREQPTTETREHSQAPPSPASGHAPTAADSITQHHLTTPVPVTVTSKPERATYAEVIKTEVERTEKDANEDYERRENALAVPDRAASCASAPPH